ncbi:MAG: NADH-quinone oxidoreductase subunit H [Ktedonobacterales bacterium]
MNSILSFVLAVLIYPGAFIALLAAWALTWGRESMQAVVSQDVVTSPLRDLSEIRSNISRDVGQPAGIYPWLTTAAACSAIIIPLIFLILLPVPGNPLVQAIGFKGDVIEGAALLLAVPVLRLLVAWATPSPYTRIAADRGVRLLAGVVLTMALAITATTEQAAVLTLHPTPVKAPLSAWWIVTHVLAALAFVFVLPPLAKIAASLRPRRQELDVVSGELTEVNGRDLACFRIAESIQLVAVSTFFATVFILPLFPSAFGHGHDLLWIAAVVVTALGIGAWDGFSERLPVSSERPPLNWWLGLPVLIALFSLVTAAIALRGS